MSFVSVGAAQAFVEGEFGGPVTEIDSELTVGAATATKLLSNNPERLSLSIINLGSNDANVAFDNQVSSTRGILLTAGGGYVNFSVRSDQMIQCREWWAYASAGSTDLYIIETKRYALTEGP